MLVTPFWFDQRQCKAEPVGENYYRVTAPNLPETFIGIRQADNGKFQGYIRLSNDGPDEGVTDPDFETPADAWDATFELFRAMMIL